MIQELISKIKNTINILKQQGIGVLEESTELEDFGDLVVEFLAENDRDLLQMLYANLDHDEIAYFNAMLYNVSSNSEFLTLKDEGYSIKPIFLPVGFSTKTKKHELFNVSGTNELVDIFRRNNLILDNEVLIPINAMMDYTLIDKIDYFDMYQMCSKLAEGMVENNFDAFEKVVGNTLNRATTGSVSASLNDDSNHTYTKVMCLFYIHKTEQQSLLLDMISNLESFDDDKFKPTMPAMDEIALFFENKFDAKDQLIIDVPYFFIMANDGVNIFHYKMIIPLNMANGDEVQSFLYQDGDTGRICFQYGSEFFLQPLVMEIDEFIDLVGEIMNSGNLYREEESKEKVKLVVDEHLANELKKYS